MRKGASSATSGRRGSERTASSFQRYLWIALGGVAILIFVGLLLLATTRPRLPRIGDHWHARYSVVICGTPLVQFPPTAGGVHTHGDGVIHIHPQHTGESGRNATLARFFQSAGVTFSRGRIDLPDGKVYQNGDRCPDGTTGSLRLLVNRKLSNAFERHIPQDRDTIIVEFGATK